MAVQEAEFPPSSFTVNVVVTSPISPQVNEDGFTLILAMLQLSELPSSMSPVEMVAEPVSPTCTVAG